MKYSDLQMKDMKSNEMQGFSKLENLENEKGLVAAFPCSQALEPWSHGGGWGLGLGPPAAWEPLEGGILAARKCCLTTLFHFSETECEK